MQMDSLRNATNAGQASRIGNTPELGGLLIADRRSLPGVALA